MELPKRLAGCKGCFYFNSALKLCDYRSIEGKSRASQNAPVQPGGGCRLKKEAGLKPISNPGGWRETRYRVVQPDGKVRYMTKQQISEMEEKQ